MPKHLRELLPNVFYLQMVSENTFEDLRTPLEHYFGHRSSLKSTVRPSQLRWAPRGNTCGPTNLWRYEQSYEYEAHHATPRYATPRRQTETDGDRERQTGTNRGRQGQTGTERYGQRRRQRQRDRETQRDTETERHRQRHTDRDTQTEIHGQRYTDRDTDRNTDRNMDRQRHGTDRRINSTDR